MLPIDFRPRGLFDEPEGLENILKEYMVVKQSGCWIGLGLLVLTAGCKSSPTLVGTWTSEGPVPVEITLNPDGTYNSTLNTKVPVKTSGTWKFKRPRLTLQVKDVALPSEIPQKVTREQKALVLKKLNENTEFAVSWKTDNQIVFSGEPPFTGSFKRKSR